MTWSAWRLSRSTAMTAAAVVAAAATYLLWTGHALRSSFATDGLLGCLTSGGPGADCSDASFAFHELTRSLTGGQPVVGFLSLLPGVIGAFVGAPLVAREIETGTLRLAWTQSVTRERWFAVRASVALAVVVATVVALTAALTYWRGPLDQIDGRVEPNAFDVQGVIPVAYAVLAFCAGLLAGVVTRRVATGIGATLAFYLVVRVLIETLVRPRLQSPVTLSFTGDPPPDLGSIVQGAWFLDQRIPKPGSGAPTVITYLPADSFWALQLLESALVLGLSVALAAVTVVWLRRRAH